MATIHFCNVLGHPQGEPIALGRRRRRLSTIAKQHGNSARPFLVSVHKGVQAGDKVVVTDDSCCRRATWKDTLIGADDVVLITYLPLGRSGGGGSSQGKQVGMAVGMIALAVAMPYAVGALGIAGSTIGALTFGGKVALAALTAGMPVSQSYILERSAA